MVAYTSPSCTPFTSLARLTRFTSTPLVDILTRMMHGDTDYVAMVPSNYVPSPMAGEAEEIAEPA